MCSNNRFAYCDTAATWGDDHISKDNEDHISKDRDTSGYVLEPDSLNHVGKVYHIELKPLFSAFHWKTFGLTTLRSFLMYYLPLLEPHTAVEDDDEDFLAEHPEKKRLDLVTPSQKAIKQIIREVCGAFLSCFLVLFFKLEPMSTRKVFLNTTLRNTTASSPIVYYSLNEPHMLHEQGCCVRNLWFAAKLHCLNWLLCYGVVSASCMSGEWWQRQWQTSQPNADVVSPKGLS